MSLPSPTEDDTKTYEIEFSDGSAQRITVPATYKVTFGAVVPTDKGSTYAGSGGWGLRFYEGTDKQRAVFTEVKRFRDLSLPMQIRAVRMFGHEDWWIDDGTWTDKKADLVEKAWVPSDQIVARPGEDPTGETVTHPYLRGMKPRRDRAFVISEGES